MQLRQPRDPREASATITLTPGVGAALSGVGEETKFTELVVNAKKKSRGQPAVACTSSQCMPRISSCALVNECNPTQLIQHTNYKSKLLVTVL